MPGEFHLTGAIDQFMLGSPTAEQLAALTGLTITLKSNILPSQGVPTSGGLFYVPWRTVTVLSSGQISEDGTNNGIMLLANDTTLGLTNPVQWTVVPGRATLGGKQIKLATWTFQAPAPGVARTLDQLAPVPTIPAVPLSSINAAQIADATTFGRGILTAADAGTVRNLIDASRFDFLGVVASQSAMLALTGQEGDWCSRSDLAAMFILTGTDPTQLSNWTEIPYPASTGEPIITPGTTSQYWRGDKTFQTLDKTAVGLANVDNTSDATKNTAPAALTNKDLTAGTNTFPTLNQNTTGSAAKLTTARTINGVAFDGTAAITVADATKEPTITAGTTSQYWRGDKTWQTLSTGASSLTPTAVKTSAYTAAAGDLVPVDATSGAFTVTLPTAPADKAIICLKKIDTSVNAVTVAAGGSDVFNTAAGSTTLALSLQFQAMQLQYASTPAIWYVVSTDVPLGGLDARYLSAGVHNLGSLGALYTLPAGSAAGVSYSVLTANTVITLPSPTVGAAFILVLQQDATGGRTPSFAGATVDYPAGNPAWITTANALNVLEFHAWDATSWHAFPATTATVGATLTGVETLTNKTLTHPKIGDVYDANGNPIFNLNPTASAVNYISTYNNGTGFGPGIGATGADPNIDLSVNSHGTGKVLLNNVQAVDISTAQALTNKDLTAGTNTFPTLNQNTTGSAAKLTTPRNINGVAFDGTANVTISAGTTLTPTAVKTAAYTAAVSDLIPADTSSGVFTITLPSAPADKSQIVIKKIDSSTNAVTIAAGGSDKFNTTSGPTSFGMALQNQAVHLQYASSSAIWYIISTDVPLGGLDARYVQTGVLTTKGDMYAATAAGTATRVPIGPDGYVLTANSAATLGVSYVARSDTTAVNNGDGTGTFTPGPTGSVTNNNDGTGTLT